MNGIMIVLQTSMLLTALAIDSFVCSFAYGANKIKIPFKSMMTINIICTILLAIGVFFGTIIGNYIPEAVTMWISFFILFLLGVSKLFDSAIKNFTRKLKGTHKEFKFSMSGLGFVLNVFSNPEEADVDNSKVLSPKEAIPLAIALGVDGLSVGLGIGLAVTNIMLLLGLSLVSDLIAISLGCYLGNKVAQRSTMDLSWLSGVILILIAILEVI